MGKCPACHQETDDILTCADGEERCRPCLNTFEAGRWFESERSSNAGYTDAATTARKAIEAVGSRYPASMFPDGPGAFARDVCAQAVQLLLHEIAPVELE